jgi:hypothetical protein
MAGRPCRPDADFRRLWRTLLPGTPFPACGVADGSETEPPAQTATDGRNDRLTVVAAEVRLLVNRR